MSPELIVPNEPADVAPAVALGVPAGPGARVATRALLALVPLLAGLAACGGDRTTTSPGGGGPAGVVSVGSGIQFVSEHNGSTNPAVDTVAAGDAVTWNWHGSLPHSVRSDGAPNFPSSGTMTGSGTYKVTFATPGTYHYDCAVHGSAMRGTIVVTGTAVASQTVTDPAGDTFGRTGVEWDLTGMTVTRDTGAVTVRLDFSSDVLSPMRGDSSGIIGFVELDLDQNPVTGDPSDVDVFRHDGGSTALGVDATIDLTHYLVDSTVFVYDSLARPVGHVRPVFAGRSITILIPRALLGNDDGYLNAAAIVGNGRSPTDFVPQSGHLTLGGARAVSAASVAAAAAPVRAARARAWGPT